nr:unnamed protein product [Spirometra erinaceieuropaei]
MNSYSSGTKTWIRIRTIVRGSPYLRLVGLRDVCVSAMVLARLPMDRYNCFQCPLPRTRDWHQSTVPGGQPCDAGLGAAADIAREPECHTIGPPQRRVSHKGGDFGSQMREGALFVI